MKVLIFGDIYGRLWRKALSQEFEKLRLKYEADFTIANIENSTGGRGPITEHAQEISDLWVDVMTGGDHIFDNAPNIYSYFKKENCNLIRPANFYESPGNIPKGTGSIIVEKNGKRLLVLQLLGEVFMSHKVSHPFLKVAQLLEEIPRDSYDACIVDFHRETTAELYGMGYFLDGKVSVVYGTHTHIQTNDAHILKKGTWIITDVGMNGPYDSVIGACYSSVEKRFLTGIQRGKIEQQLTGPYIISALFVEIDDSTGLCTQIENISYTGNI